MSELTEEAEGTEEVEEEWMIGWGGYGAMAGGIGAGVQARYRA